MYLVGVGASAGGLDALSKFFQHAPKHEDISYVVIQHLSPNYKSLMDELLRKYTNMDVYIAENEMIVEPGNIYLIPPNHYLRVINGTLYLEEYKSRSILSTPIDVFFHSLGNDFANKSVAVILSGTGSDGTKGIKSVRENGGLIITQDEFSAQFDGMPMSAIFTGLVDHILTPEEMGKVIFKYVSKHKEIAPNYDDQDDEMIEYNESLKTIFTQIKTHFGLDLSYYKISTVMRRIERRMTINQLNSLDKYASLINQNNEELETLCNEILIGVTRFFRDREAFDYIKTTIIPEILAKKDWVMMFVFGLRDVQQVRKPILIPCC